MRKPATSYKMTGFGAASPALPGPATPRHAQPYPAMPSLELHLSVRQSQRRIL